MLSDSFAALWASVALRLGVARAGLWEWDLARVRLCDQGFGDGAWFLGGFAAVVFGGNCIVRQNCSLDL